MLREAENLLRLGETERARRLLSGESGAAAKVLLARLAVRSGDHSRAESLYREALVADPCNLAALRSLTVTAQMAGRVEEARDLLERWAAEDPNDPEQEDLRGELEQPVLESASEELRPLPVVEDLEEVLTRPQADPVSHVRIIEGELMPAPSLADPDLWDEGDQPVSKHTSGEA